MGSPSGPKPRATCVLQQSLFTSLAVPSGFFFCWKKKGKKKSIYAQNSTSDAPILLQQWSHALWTRQFRPDPPRLANGNLILPLTAASISDARRLVLVPSVCFATKETDDKKQHTLL
ncbi:hypothetical protein XA68_12288 [Ophiocordyceps unilateralis]|uniref:Uncharacterized protein n=1 Tax=Ophiocordyceps unilateralis TaxID=268505 RepID=A0A2A9PF42_OPHUN|nr:hypothetical protein XA68_12288 [Ophiocordyceps unilateralis]